MSDIDDAFDAYQQAFPHTLTMDVLFAAIDEEPEDTARKLREAVQTGIALADEDFQSHVAPEVML